MLDLGELSARVTVNRSAVAPALRGVVGQFQRASRAIAQDARDNGQRAGQQLGDSFRDSAKRSVGRGVGVLGGVLAMGAKGFAGLAAVGVGAIGAVGAAGLGMGVKVAAGNEQARIAFTTMLGSAKEADVFLRDLQKFAASTPFEFPELQRAASSLVSAGIEAKDVLPIMRNLGDVTAGMGTGSEGIQRATVALQQMNAAGKITGEDLNQLRDAGIPVYDLLAKSTGKSKAEIAKLAAAGKLGKKELDAMMGALANPKGAAGLERFAGLMDEQANSLSGLWSTAKDVMGQGLAAAVTPLIPLIKQGLGGATDWLLGMLKQLPAVLLAGVDRVQDFAASPAWATIRRVAGRAFQVLKDGAVAVPGLIREARDALQRFGESDTWGVIRDAGGGIATVFRDDVLPVLRWLKNTGAPAVGSLVEQLAEWRNVLEPIGLGLGVVWAGLAAVTFWQRASAGGGFLKYLRGVAAATKVWAGIQWVLNAAMAANPLGLLIIGLAAVAAGVIYAYKHSDRFREAVQKLGRTIAQNWREMVADLKRVGRDIAQNWREMVAGLKKLGADIAQNWRDMGAGLRKVGRDIARNWREMRDGVVQLGRDIRDGVVRTWRRVRDTFVQAGRDVRDETRETWASITGWFARSGRKVSDGVSDLWQRIRDTFVRWGVRVYAAVRGLWSDITGRFTAAYRWVKGWGARSWDGLKTLLTDPVQAGRNAIRNLFGEGTGLRGIFRRAVETLGRIWDGLKAKMRTPIKGVIDIVNNGIIDSFNWVVNKLKLGKTLGIARMAYPKGWQSGGPTTSTASDSEPVGVVHGNEHIATAQEVRLAGGHGVWEAARALARRGRLRERLHGALPGYFLGGGVQPVPGRVNPHRLPYHGARWAGDIPAAGGTPVKAWKAGVVAAVQHLTTSYGKHVRINHPGGEQTLYAHLSRIIASVGGRIARSQVLGYVGSTGNSTGNHLHLEVRGGNTPITGGGGDAGSATETVKAGWLGRFANPVAFLRDRATKALGRLGLDKMGGTGLPGILKQIPEKLLGSTLHKIQGVAASAWNTVRAVGAHMKTIFTAPGKSGSMSAEQMRNAAIIASVGSGLGRRAQVIGLITALVESNLRNVGYGDRDSVGLFQQRTPWGPRSARMDPAQSAAMFYNGGRGGQRGLTDIRGWQSMPPGAAAQAVQVSAFPGRYGQQIVRAMNILDSLKPKGGYASGTSWATAGIHPVAEGGAELVVNPGFRRFRGSERVETAKRTRQLLGGQQAPLVGTLQLVERRTVRQDLADVDWELRKIAHGGVHNGRTP